MDTSLSGLALLGMFIVFFFYALLIDHYDAGPSIPDRPMTCPNCQASFESPDSVICWNCGTDLSPYSRTEMPQTPSQRSSPVKTVMRHEKDFSRPIGVCAVCRFDVNDNDEAIWCPRCGTIAHKDHFLEWLHVKHSCPVCKEHLHEELLMQLMS